MPQFPDFFPWVPWSIGLGTGMEGAGMTPNVLALADAMSQRIGQSEADVAREARQRFYGAGGQPDTTSAVVGPGGRLLDLPPVAPKPSPAAPPALVVGADGRLLDAVPLGTPRPVPPPTAPAAPPSIVLGPGNRFRDPF